MSNALYLADDLSDIQRFFLRDFFAATVAGCAHHQRRSLPSFHGHEKGYEPASGIAAGAR